jgi:hypothetical protein
LQILAGARAFQGAFGFQCRVFKNEMPDARFVIDCSGAVPVPTKLLIRVISQPECAPRFRAGLATENDA